MGKNKLNNLLADDKKEYDNINGVECIVREDILDYIQKQSRGCGAKHQDKIYGYPSELSFCKRAVYYTWLGVESEDWDYPVERKMIMGNLLHPFLAEMFTRSGLFADIEAHASNIKHGTSYRPDYLMRINFKKQRDIFQLPYKSKAVVEFKTVGDWVYEHYIPKSDDELQLQYYMGEERVQAGFLLYFCRDWRQWATKWSSDITIFEIPFDKGKYKKVIKIFKNIGKTVEDKKVPKREGTKSKFPCKGCRYFYHCWEK